MTGDPLRDDVAPTPSWGEDDVVVVGAGISGIACARRLVDAGHRVVVLDRGRRPGGRLAVRRVEGDGGERVVDVGASYLVPRDAAFTAVARRWQDAGLARPWTDTFAVTEAGRPPEPKAGPVRWSAPGGLRSLVDDLAVGLDIRTHAARSVTSGPTGPRVDGRVARAVVLAMPDPQAARLLGDGLAVDHAVVHDRAWEPVLAVLARWPERWWGPHDGFFVNDDDVVAFVADDGRRRGDDAPVLVAHTTPGFAAQHLQEPRDAVATVLGAVRAALGGASEPDPVESGVQRWTFARPAAGRDEPFHLGGVGVCGDAWGPRPGVEQAWVSGHRLGAALAQRLEG